MINGADVGGYDVAAVSLLGGELCLDFVNTIEDRTSDHPDDTLRTPDDLRRWGVRLGVLSTGDVTGVVRSELTRSTSLRGALLGILSGRIEGTPIDRSHLALLSRELAAAFRESVLESENGVLQTSWDPTRLSSLRHRVAVDAVRLLSDQHGARLRRCDNPDCGWYFLDTSKAGRRRWCSMQGCGTLAKSQRRQERS